jgi:tetratricopeptide (TPR) repeat protein
MVRHHEGLILLLAGRAAEAEALFRKALAMVESGSAHPRERLYSCVGHALTAQGRYDEAEDYLNKAIQAGDITGNSQNGLARLRLDQGRNEEALALVTLAIEVAKRRANRRFPGIDYADQALALARPKCAARYNVLNSDPRGIGCAT